jgi:uncharacterized protein (TIGR04255 family)
MVGNSSTIPKRLRKEPLVEALWEIRFRSDNESVGDLLPGLVFKAMGALYPKIERLPAANLPSSVLQQDATLHYIPTIRLEGNPYSIQIGKHVVSLSCRRPYTGWGQFEPRIFELADMLKETNLLTRLERFSLKYIDIIPWADLPSLEPLQILIKLGEHELTNNPVQLRTELRENGFLHIVKIASPAQAALPTGESFEGVLIDLDTIYQQESNELWPDFSHLLGRAHKFSKSLFFHLLTKEMIDQLEPEY